MPSISTVDDLDRLINSDAVGHQDIDEGYPYSLK
jgi:hypothetical protein